MVFGIMRLCGLAEGRKMFGRKYFLITWGQIWPGQLVQIFSNYLTNLYAVQTQTVAVQIVTEQVSILSSKAQQRIRNIMCNFMYYNIPCFLKSLNQHAEIST